MYNIVTGMLKKHSHMRGKLMLYLIKSVNVSLILVFALYIFASCSPQIHVDADFNKEEARHYLYFADPDGGIRAYHASHQTLHEITEGYDFHPNFLESEEVWFLRFDREVSENDNHQVKVMQWDIKNDRVRQVNNLTSIPSSPDPAMQVFFVDQGEKILLLHHSREPQLIDIEMDRHIDYFSLSDYLEGLNYFDQSSQKAFGWLIQYPYQNVLKNKKDLDLPPSYAAIISLNKELQWTIWDSIPREDMFEQSYNGFAFDNFHQFLFFSKDKTLYRLKSHDQEKISIVKGIHPFIYQDHAAAYANNVDIIRFPWPISTLLLQDNETSFIGTTQFLSIIHHPQLSFASLTEADTIFMSKNYLDPAQLFDRLIFIGKLKPLPSSYFLVSMKKIETGDRLATIKRDKVDIISIFTIRDSSWFNQWFSSSQFYSEVWLDDLNNNGYPEVIHHYCASTFPCSEEIMLNSRSLVWINVYSINEYQQYERSSEKFPEIYRELWERLFMVEEELKAYQREGILFLCDEDVQLLKELIEQSRHIALED